MAFALIGGVGVVIVVLAAVLSPFLREGSFILGILFLFPIALGLGGLALAWFLGQKAQRTQEDRRWRLAGFSRDVGMEYVPSVPAPPLPGVLFGIGATAPATTSCAGANRGSSRSATTRTRRATARTRTPRGGDTSRSGSTCLFLISFWMPWATA